QIDSEVADMKNIGAAGNAGSITAAQFLQRFVDDGRAWAHLDIAGTAWKPGNDNPLQPTWATGRGGRILDRLIDDNYEDWADGGGPDAGRRVVVLPHRTGLARRRHRAPHREVPGTQMARCGRRPRRNGRAAEPSALDVAGRKLSASRAVVQRR